MKRPFLILATILVFSAAWSGAQQQPQRPTEEQLTCIEQGADLTKARVTIERLTRKVQELQKQLDEKGSK